MAHKKYKTDRRSPVPKSATVSEVMSRIGSKDTGPELIVRKYLYHHGMRGYRVNYKKLPGRPDIVFVGKRIAIFINGCYWHRCPYCNLPVPKTNTEFWVDKFQKNITRDLKRKSELMAMGWQVVTIWECEVENGLFKDLPLFRAQSSP